MSDKTITTEDKQNKPPRAVKPATLTIAVAIFIVALALGTVLASPIRNGFSRAIGIFSSAKDSHDQSSGDTAASQYYTCGMHPWVVLPKPGDCPICHMKLTPLDPDKFTGEIAIDPLVVQNIGVRTAPVETGPLVRTIRTVGTVDYNETLVRDVNIKVTGWIDKLYVDYLGAKVQMGDVLLDLYSPQLYAAQEEYIIARQNFQQTDAGTLPELAQTNKELLDSVRTRLLYFDITEQQIAKLEKTGKPSKTMAIRSPHTGVVIEKHANEGMNVDLGMRVFRVADLSKVWAIVTLYEYQLPFVQKGQPAVMTLPYIPGERFEGKVVFIYPYLDKKTREVQVRLEFDNSNGLLKPGMFANVELQNELARKKTLAPREAIIDTGQRSVAFVSMGEGRFEPRDVRMGVETGDGKVEILDGLKPGELVVTSGQFLIDSEAKLREALAKMVRGDLAAQQKPTAAQAGQSELSSQPTELATKLAEALKSYTSIGDRLAGDSLEGIAEHAKVLADVLDATVKLTIPDQPHFWHKHTEAATVRAGALALIDQNDIAEARLQYAELSLAFEKLLIATGVPSRIGHEMQILRCPMFRSGQGGGIWIQSAGDVRNPYFGSMMLRCFDERKSMPVVQEAAP